MLNRIVKEDEAIATDESWAAKEKSGTRIEADAELYSMRREPMKIVVMPPITPRGIARAKFSFDHPNWRRLASELPLSKEEAKAKRSTRMIPNPSIELSLILIARAKVTITARIK